MEPPFFSFPGWGPPGLDFALAAGFALAEAPPGGGAPSPGGGAPRGAAAPSAGPARCAGEAPPGGAAGLAASARSGRGGAPPFGDAAAPRGPRSRSACPSCSGELARGVGEAGLTCRDCGLILDGGDDEDEEADRGKAPRMARLRLVGPGSSQLQPNLFRSGPAAAPEVQKGATCAFLEGACASWRRAGRHAPGRDACAAAADLYYEVQLHVVKRSEERRNIIGACLYRACLELREAPVKADIARMVGLDTDGLAAGLNFLNAFRADGKLSVEMNVDPCEAEVNTLFARLGLHGDEYSGLQAAAADVVRTAIASLIGVHSVLRSKVAGATFAVLQRCRDPRLISRAPTFAEFCAGRGEAAGGAATRKNTIEAFTAELGAYHSFFEPCYRRAGLDPAPPPPPPARPPARGARAKGAGVGAGAPAKGKGSPAFAASPLPGREGR